MRLKTNTKIWGIGGLSLLALAFLGTTSCGARLEGQAKGIDKIIKQAWENGAYNCQPKHLTLAEANLRGARDRLGQGFYHHAKSLLSVSAKHARSALDGSPPEKCKQRVAILPPREAPRERPRAVVKLLDTDGDGILDNVDKCPKVPEDKDGFEDEDGCPDLDNDGDGIPDKVDKCPGTDADKADKFAKTKEDKDGFEDDDGCPDPDNDGDGIPDKLDKCPGKDADKADKFAKTKEDKDGFEDDDGCPDLDNDKDGIADKIDKCPNDPEDKDGFQDDDGCPDPDNDNDRICDPNPTIQKNIAKYNKVCTGKDKCPMKPENYNSYQDTDGCPDKKLLVTVTKTKIELSQKVFFAYNKARIRARSFQLLRDVALVLKDNPNIHVRIEGHTDSRGSSRYNRRLSQKRADSVRRFMIKEGVGGERMIAKGYGEDKPIASNRSRSGREKNRRVEFVITRR